MDLIGPGSFFMVTPPPMRSDDSSVPNVNWQSGNQELGLLSGDMVMVVCACICILD